MKLKTAVAIGIIFSVLMISAHAKSKDAQTSKPLTGDEIVARMKIQLQLTQEQTERVKPIIENYLTQEQQLKLDEKKQLSRVLTDGQMFTWNFLQNDNPREKEKKKRKK